MMANHSCCHICLLIAYMPGQLNLDLDQYVAIIAICFGSVFSRAPMVGGIGNVWRGNWSGGLRTESLVGFRDKAPVGGQGAKPPEAEHFCTNYKKF